jgi:hypothetical protein
MRDDEHKQHDEIAGQQKGNTCSKNCEHRSSFQKGPETRRNRAVQNDLNTAQSPSYKLNEKLTPGRIAAGCGMGTMAACKASRLSQGLARHERQIATRSAIDRLRCAADVANMQD